MEEQLLNQVGQYIVDEVRRTFDNLYPSRSFGGVEKPIAGQFPPVFASKNATGKYINSLTYKIDTDPEDGQPYIQIVSTLPEDENYGRYIESGRQPGTFPNIGNIRKWITAKGITPKRLEQRNSKGNPVYKIPNLSQLTYLISRSIARDGIFPFPFRDITLQRIEKELSKKLEPALAEKIDQLIKERVVFMINPQRQTR